MSLEIKDIGADPRKGRISEQNYLPFRSLDAEILGVAELISPRFGYHPRSASVEVNTECNLACRHCNMYKRSGGDLTPEEMHNVLKNLIEVGVTDVDYTGGEPLLREDLPELVSISSGLGLRTTLNTNGGIKKAGLAEEDYFKQLAQRGLFGVHFSYDGRYPKNDPRVIGLARYCLTTLHIYAGVRTVVTKDNLAVVENIGELCMANSVFFQAVPAVAKDGVSSASSDNFRPLDTDGWREYIAINRRLSKVRGPFAKFLRMSEGYLKKVASAPNPETAWHCKKLSAHQISVDNQGYARVCNDVSLPKVYSLKGEENPLLDKEFHKDVERASKECPGCAWYCHWFANRKRTAQISEWRLLATVASLT